MAQAVSTTTVKSLKSSKPDIPFTWEGRDKKGLKVKGKSIAADEAALRADLRRQGIAASRIRKQSNALRSGGRVQPQDIAVFMRQLATMLAAGIPLVQGLEIVGSGHDKPSAQKLILSVKSDIEAGEHAGALESLLDKIASYKEKTEALKSKVKKALFYPAAVLVVAVIVTVILLIFVIPQFESLL